VEEKKEEVGVTTWDIATAPLVQLEESGTMYRKAKER
jgi:hypothetical protein